MLQRARGGQIQALRRRWGAGGWDLWPPPWSDLSENHQIIGLWNFCSCNCHQNPICWVPKPQTTYECTMCFWKSSKPYDRVHFCLITIPKNWTLSNKYMILITVAWNKYSNPIISMVFQKLRPGEFVGSRSKLRSLLLPPLVWVLCKSSKYSIMCFLFMQLSPKSYMLISKTPKIL